MTHVHEEVVLLIGSQNAGKTTLFNKLTNSRYKQVNYPGSTVSCAKGNITENKHIHCIDTPGITSLISRSEDEAVTISCLENISLLFPSLKRLPIHLLLVLDATQLSRQLVLCRQLIDLNIPFQVVLTMLDLAKKDGIHIKLKRLEKQLNCTVYTPETLKQYFNNGLKKQSYSFTQPRFSEASIQRQFKWAKSVHKQVSTHTTKTKQLDPDQLLLHPVFGFVFFSLIMTGLFWAIFSLVSPISDTIDFSLSYLGTRLLAHFPNTLIIRFIAEGLISSIAGVAVFIPQIAMLFFIIGLLEGSGYLARGAALIDRPLSKIGLNGRAFVPLLSGFACAIPAMMATRTISNKKQRLITLFVIPLMSCSARLPVYGLLLGLLSQYYSNFFAGLAMTGIYFTSIIISAIVAKLLNLFIPNENKDGFYIELPRWRRPQIKHIAVQTYHQTKSFIFRAGPIILSIGIFLWGLSSFPSPEQSYAHQLGKILEPVWAPLGIDWRVGFALIVSFAAREVFVSALAVIFAAEASNTQLLSTLSSASFPTGEPIFTIPTIIGLILFFMISMQCVTTLAVAKQEIGNWKTPLIMGASYILLAYFLASAIQFLFA